MILKEHQKFADSTVLEGMTSISSVINSGDDNDRKIERVLIDAARRKAKQKEIGFLTAKSHELGFPVAFVTAEEIDAITVGNSHGGIVALCSDRTLPALTPDAIKPNGFYVYLDGVEDPYNLGYTCSGSLDEFNRQQLATLEQIHFAFTGNLDILYQFSVLTTLGI